MNSFTHTHTHTHTWIERDEIEETNYVRSENIDLYPPSIFIPEKMK
jgi:hypothetical protein